MARKPDLFALIAAHNKSLGKSASSSGSPASRDGAGTPGTDLAPGGTGPAPGGTAAQDAGPASNRRSTRKPAGLQPLLSKAGHWLHGFAERVVPQARRRRVSSAESISDSSGLSTSPGHAAATRPSGPRPQLSRDVRLGGIGIAVVALVALGIGFVAGRAFGRPTDSAKPAAETELNVPAKGAKAAKWLIDPTAGTLPTGEKLTQELANWCYPVLLYQASERAKAEQLASYLWNHGVVSARIRPFTHKSSDTNETKDYWGTVVYVTSEKDGLRSVEELAKVPTPAFAPNLPEMIVRLRELLSQGRGMVAVPTR